QSATSFSPTSLDVMRPPAGPLVEYGPAGGRRGTLFREALRSPPGLDRREHARQREGRVELGLVVDVPAREHGDQVQLRDHDQTLSAVAERGVRRVRPRALAG